MEGSIKDLVSIRFDRAKEMLGASQVNFEQGELKTSLNRSYYAIFHAINAVHSLDGHSYKKHKDAISNFNKKYVKTNIFDRSIGRKISDAEEVRHASDYDDFYIARRDDAEKQIISAEELINIVESYCQERIEKETHFS